MEGRHFPPFASLWKRSWLLRCVRPIASLLGFDQGTGVHYLPHHLSFTRGYDSSVCNPAPGASTWDRNAGHSIVHAGNLPTLVTRTRLESCAWPSLAHYLDSDLSALGLAGVLHEVFREFNLLGRPFSLYDTDRIGAQPNCPLDDRFFRSN